MREIKLRAWDKQEKRIVPIYTLLFGSRGLSASSPGKKLVDYELMQYTGLKDKNGVEIYEGDILALGGTEEDGHKGPYEHVAIECRLGGSGYEFYYGYPGKHNYHAPYWVEVIGNIYENPELLKESA